MNPENAPAFAGAETALGPPSLLGIVLDAPMGVQLAILVLLAVFVWALVVGVRKSWQLSRVRKEGGKFEKVFWSGQALDELYQGLAQRRNAGLAALFVAAMREWKRSMETEGGTATVRSAAAVQERVGRIMAVTAARDVAQLQRGLGLLTMIAAVAPLIGLFGGAWGLMSAFQSAGNVDLAGLPAMAPGIAASLLAVALGFLAALPAKSFGLKVEAELRRHAARLEGFAGEFSNILSRQLERVG